MREECGGPVIGGCLCARIIYKRDARNIVINYK